MNRSYVLLPAAIALAAGVALAQEPPTSPAPWRPAEITSDSLSLVEAARLTLSHQPGIRLREEEAAFGAGRLLEESGRFDQFLVGETLFSYDKRELRGSQKKSERDKRDALRRGIAEQEEGLAETQRTREEIAQRRDGDPRTPISDPELEAILDLIDAELENATRPEAIQALLDLRARTLDTALARYDEAIGELRVSIAEDRERLAALGPIPKDEETYRGRFLLQYVFPFRNGLAVAPFFEYTLDGDRYVGKPAREEGGGKGVPDAYRASLGFTVDLPLARGFGAVSTASREEAARAEYQGRLALAAHAASAGLTETGLAYWDARAALERLAILEASEERQERLVELTRALVDSEELPGFELSRADAQWASAQAALEEGRRSELASRVALARAVGLDVRTGEPPLPADPLPDLTGLTPVRPDELAGGYDRVLARRLDLRAAREFVAAAEVFTRAAQHDLKPRVDFSARAYANSFAEFSGRDAFTGRWIGPSYDLRLVAERPLGNRTQRGRLLQAEAAESLRGIDLAEQERIVVTDIVELTGGLRAAVAADRAAREAAEGYRQAMDAETEKLRANESTLVDVLLTEQRWTEARLAAVAARRDAARLLVQLRFATATLVEGEGPQREVSGESFISLPDTEEERP